jgi:hypothetical protein
MREQERTRENFMDLVRVGFGSPTSCIGRTDSLEVLEHDCAQCPWITNAGRGADYLLPALLFTAQNFMPMFMPILAVDVKLIRRCEIVERWIPLRARVWPGARHSQIVTQLMKVAHRSAITDFKPELLLEKSMDFDPCPVKLSSLKAILQDRH